MIPGELELTPIARRRLAAIREFSDLGAGFRIAALDLELRGAGNLLGGQQSGHMDALGFDLYTQMLERTVAELRGETVEDRRLRDPVRGKVGFDLYTQMLERTVAELRGEVVEDETSVTINLGVDVAISDDYINDMGQRLRTYKRVSSARDEEALFNIRNETQDRYGRLPESVEQLFAYAGLRRLAEDLRVLSIDKTAEGVALKFSENARISTEKLAALISAREGRGFSPTGVLKLQLNDEEQDNLLDTVRGVLMELRLED